MFVKICGITNEEDALLAVALGADAVGFVFAPIAPPDRPARAYDIARRLPPEILTVGVFRDEAPTGSCELVRRPASRPRSSTAHETPEAPGPCGSRSAS